MAESIADAYTVARRRPRQPVVVHVNGAFHSDYGQGTAARVMRRLPGKRVVVVSIRPVADLDAIASTATTDRRSATYVGVYSQADDAGPKGPAYGLVCLLHQSHFRHDVRHHRDRRRVVGHLFRRDARDGVRRRVVDQEVVAGHFVRHHRDLAGRRRRADVGAAAGGADATGAERRQQARNRRDGGARRVRAR